MPKHTTLCLFDVTGLDGLAEVCRRLHVRLQAHGGLVRRLSRHLHRQEPSVMGPGLFELMGFAGDVDLIHDGPDTLTGPVIAAIHDHVPHAECFRWEVRSARSQARFDTALLTSGIVPVNLMRLLTAPGSGVWDPWDGWKDIEKGKYRYIRNGFYHDSSLYKSGRDLECFSALLYCQALLEAGVTDFADAEQPGIEDARAVFHDARSDHTRLALQEHAYLRARLLYLMSASSPRPTPLSSGHDCSRPPSSTCSCPS
jgi:hypothetical protein